ncbi:hypothetical protein [Priestia megaterium]|uniref:hypothetical protein n=1 Tax=Priestia megaterium TaxID=1404 RepID=UPI0022B86AE0|nr:hypothetical protein [Priestia megaterium]MCZ8497261.1 hypothetical protein [Priestia megaterium]
MKKGSENCHFNEPADLSLCVVTAKGSRVTDGIIANHLFKAREIWPNIPIPEPCRKTMSYEPNAEDIDPNESIPNDKNDIRYIAMRECPDVDIAVVYIKGQYFKDKNTIAVSYYTDERPYLIVMSDGTIKSDYALAHELGHILFHTFFAGIANDPNPYKRPDGTIDYAHDNDSHNVMWPNAPLNAVSTKEQREIARFSTLLGNTSSDK